MIQDSVNKVIYNGNGEATEFFYPFEITKNTDVKVMTVSPDGGETVLTNDYYVDVAKSIVYYPGWADGETPDNADDFLPLADGWRLVVYREVDYTQEVSMFEQYPFNVIEGMIDKTTILTQQLKDETNRSMRLGVAVDNTDIDMVIPHGQGTSFRWSDDGTKLEVTDDPAKVLPKASNILTQTQEQANAAVRSAETATEKASEASTSASNAKTSENSASASASSASASESNAKAYMDTAKGYMEQAGTSASSASTSATNAKSSETNASVSASSAYTSASEANTSAVHAKTSETNASESEAKALASENNAKTSENEAKRYAEEAFVTVEQNKSDKLPIGFQYFTTNPNIPVGELPLLGGEYSREAYADLWEWIQNQTGFLITEAEWQEKATANGGNVAFYSDGDGSTTFRVQSLSCWVKGANDIEEVGSYLEDMFGSHTHDPKVTSGNEIDARFTMNQDWGSSAVARWKVDKGTGVTVMGSDVSAADYTANDITQGTIDYTGGEETRPKSIVGMWLVKAFGTVSNVGNQDIADVSAGLTDAETRLTDAETRLTDAETRLTDAETRLTLAEEDISNIPTPFTARATSIGGASTTKPAVIIQTYKSSTNWYRVYSDGWIEQGGTLTNTANEEKSLTFAKPFTSTDYVFFRSPIWAKSGSGTYYNIGCLSKTATAVTFQTDSTSYYTKYDWYACGY